MDIKEILKQSLKDGVNQFIDSTLSQLDEGEEPSFEELLEESIDTLNFVQTWLKPTVEGKFSKDLKDIDSIWASVMIFAIVLKGNNIESTDFQGMNDIFEKFDNISIHWERAKAFLMYLKNSEDSEYCQYLSYLPDLEEECCIFYYTMLQLKNWDGGFCTTSKRKFKKYIGHCTAKLYSACNSYIYQITFGIPVLSELFGN